MSQIVSYSNTIGTKGSVKGAKNNSISTATDLAQAEKHANHDYTQEEIDKMSSDIDLSKKHLNRLFECRDSKNVNEVDYLSLVEIIKDYYHIYFDKSLNDFNTRMELEGKTGKIIDDYFEYVCNHPRLQVAVQGIIQTGDYILWSTLSAEDRIKATYVNMKLLKLTVDLFKSQPGGDYICAGAAGHNDEKSSHLHHYGISIATDSGCNVMETRISKSAVFTREALRALQNEVRKAAEEIVNQEFDWIFKEKGEVKRKSLSKPAYVWLVNKLMEKECVTNVDDPTIIYTESDLMEKMIYVPESSNNAFIDALEREYQPIALYEESEDLDEKLEDTPDADTDYIRTLLSLLEILFNLDNRRESPEDEKKREELFKAFWEMIDKDCTQIIYSNNLTEKMIDDALFILEEERKPKRLSLKERIRSAEEKRDSQGMNEKKKINLLEMIR